jgi:glutathione S-transferase
MTIKLYHGNISTCSQKVRLALAEKQLEFDSYILDLRAGDQFAKDYRKINSAAVVPTLINGEDIVTESTVINEYIDDEFSGVSLKPDSAIERARMRQWTKQLDEGIHSAIGILSFCIAFRHDFLSKSDAEMQKFFDDMSDPQKKEFYETTIKHGMDHPEFISAAHQFDKLLHNMEIFLGHHEWLAGESYTLADIGFTPYMLRLDHLQLSPWWQDKPNLKNWYQQLQERDNYQSAITSWLPQPAIDNFQRVATQAWEQVSQILDK